MIGTLAQIVALCELFVEMIRLEPVWRRTHHHVHVEQRAYAFHARREARGTEQLRPVCATRHIGVDHVPRAAEIGLVFDVEGAAEAEFFDDLPQHGARIRVARYAPDRLDEFLYDIKHSVLDTEVFAMDWTLRRRPSERNSTNSSGSVRSPR